MAAGWPGRGLAMVCVLAGCTGQPLSPTRGGPPASSPPPASSRTAADADGVTRVVDGGAPAIGVGAGSAGGPVDAAVEPIPVVRTPANVLTGADLSAAEVLAADDDGIYWVTGDNRLWMLPAWSETPVVLAADISLSAGLTAGATLLVRGNYIFWSASVLRPGLTIPARPLHRTLKTGSDTVLFSDRPALPAADAGYLYALRGGVDQGDLAIVTLPLDADPGATPVTLTVIPPGMDVSALAVDDQNVYWTECAVGSTMFEGTGPIFGGGKAGLLAGGHSSFGQLTGLFAYLLAPSSGRLYFEFAPRPGAGQVALLVDDDGAQAVLPLPPSQTVLPLPAGRSLLAFDGWLVSSTAQLANPGGKIYAVPADAVAGDGLRAVQIADDVALPPVAGRPGLVFVDAAGHLVAVTTSDLGAAVAAGQR